MSDFSVLGKRTAVSAGELKAMIQSSGCWDDSCSNSLSPLQNFCYDRLQYNFSVIFGDTKILINPVMAVCRSNVCAQKMGIVKLKRICDLKYFHSHLLGHHGDNWAAAALPRISLLIENNFPTEQEISCLPALPNVVKDQELESLLYDRHLEGRHYLSYWKNIFYTNKLLGNQHLNYQEDDALIEELLSFPSPLSTWDKWPTVKAYATKLTSILSESEYDMFRGQRRVKRKMEPSLEGLETFINSLNHTCPG